MRTFIFLIIYYLYNNFNIFLFLSFSVDFLFVLLYNIIEIEEKQNVWLPPTYIKGVVLMLECMFTIIVLLSIALVAISIIAFALAIALAIIISK